MRGKARLGPEAGKALIHLAVGSYWKSVCRNESDQSDHIYYYFNGKRDSSRT